MISTIIIILQIMLIFLILIILKEDHYLRMIIFYAAFSLISAVLYYFFNAPDVALAELAIGCAFIPLMFIIAISKQREFIIIFHPTNETFVNDFGKQCKYEYDLLYIFCLENKLSLKVYDSKEITVEGVFRPKNADIIIDKENEKYVFKLKETNALTHQFINLIKESRRIDVRWIEEHEKMG